MPRPASLPTHATDANYTSGPDAGGATKLEPAAGVKAQGFVPGTGFASQWWNWTVHRICEWIEYLTDERDALYADRTVPIDVALPATRRAYPEVDTQWDHVLSGSVWIWQATLANGLLFFPIRVPPGAVIKSVAVRGKQISTVNRLSFSISTYDLDSSEVAALQSTSQDFGASTATQTRTLTLPTPEAVDSTRLFYLRALAGSVGDEIYGAQVTYGYP